MNNFVGHLMTFRNNGDGETTFEKDVFVEVVEINKDGRIELGFDMPNNIRGYLKFRLQDMMADLARQCVGEE
jgi:hypothetical protein